MIFMVKAVMGARMSLLQKIYLKKEVLLRSVIFRAYSHSAGHKFYTGRKNFGFLIKIVDTVPCVGRKNSKISVYKNMKSVHYSQKSSEFFSIFFSFMENFQVFFQKKMS